MHSHTEATVANPNTSEEAKEHSRQVIEDIQGGEYEAAERTPNMTYDMIDGKDAGNVLRGHKVGYRFCLLPDIGLSVDPRQAAVNNPNVSDKAKEHSREVLEEYGAE